MRFKRQHLPALVIVVALAVNDMTTWIECRNALGWLLGDLRTLAATSLLLLANAVTAAFFLAELEPKHVRRLHAVAGYLYCTIALCVYASAVQHGRLHFPTDVAAGAFGLSTASASVIGAMVVGAALAICTWVFWSAAGALIQARIARNRVAWEEQASRHGLPVDNVLVGMNGRTVR